MTLFGGVLIHLSLASSHTFGNMSPYIISYLREYDDLDVRYSQAIWIFAALSISVCFTTIIGGMIGSRFNLSHKLLTLIGCVIIRFDNI
jgi:hypothetical protein